VSVGLGGLIAESRFSYDPKPLKKEMIDGTARSRSLRRTRFRGGRRRSEGFDEFEEEAEGFDEFEEEAEGFEEEAEGFEEEAEGLRRGRGLRGRRFPKNNSRKHTGAESEEEFEEEGEVLTNLKMIWPTRSGRKTATNSSGVCVGLRGVLRRSSKGCAMAAPILSRIPHPYAQVAGRVAGIAGRLLPQRKMTQWTPSRSLL